MQNRCRDQFFVKALPSQPSCLRQASEICAGTSFLSNIRNTCFVLEVMNLLFRAVAFCQVLQTKKHKVKAAFLLELVYTFTAWNKGAFTFGVALLRSLSKLPAVHETVAPLVPGFSELAQPVVDW